MAKYSLEEILGVWFPKNTRLTFNNVTDAKDHIAIPSNSLRFYDLVKDAVEYLGISSGTNTNISIVHNSATADVNSSTGTGGVINAANFVTAGLMTPVDKSVATNLVILSGVAALASHLGSFSGTIIPDNSSIKVALQSLETAIGSISIPSFGNLTPSTSAIAITGGTGAVKGAGTTINFIPGNVALSTLGGQLNLTQISGGVASIGDSLTYDGVNWTPTTTIPVPHNGLSGLQGGTFLHRYHVSEGIHTKLTATTAGKLLGRNSSTSGEVEFINAINSIAVTSNNISLVNDNNTPGNNKYYGTDGSGVKGWQTTTSSSVTIVNVTDDADIDFDITDATTTPTITATLTATGISAGTYGMSSQIPSITVDTKGRISDITLEAINITTSSISNIDETIDDRVSSLLVAGTNITLTYNDIANTLTIASTSGSVGGTGTINRIPYWLNSTTLIDDADLMFDGNYLTVGSPTPVSLSRITSKGTGTTQSTFGYVHQNSTATDVLKIADNGAITLGVSGEVFIHPDAINLGTGGTFPISVFGGNMYLYSDETVVVESGGLTTNKPSLTVTSTRNSASQHQYNARTNGTFAPLVAGTNTYTELHINPTINQTAHTGITKGIFIEPILTSAVDFRALEINATGQTAIRATGKIRFDLPGVNATGNIFYRNSSGELSALPITTDGDVLTLNSGIPSWAPAGSASLPAGSSGDILVHNGTSYVSASAITETQTGITSSALSLASTPLSFALLTIYRNGLYQAITDDFTISGTVVTWLTPLVASDKITAIYYI